MADPQYTVAISNYNMAGTLEASLTSVLEQVDNRFEVLVVDDGSDDGSEALLERLAKSYDRLRLELNAGNNNLGEARNHSFREAKGDYVLSAVDTDDQFTDVITQFVTLYHEIEAVVEDGFLLLAGGLYMAPKPLIVETPYRSLGYGEDRDFYRRLLAKDALISISHVPFRFSIGYDRSVREQFEVGLETIVVQFQSGLHFWPYMRWALEELRNDGGQLESHRALAHLLLAPLAYLRSRSGPRYDAPEAFTDIGVYKQALRDAHMTLEGIEEKYDVTVDRDTLGPRGCALFDIDTVDSIID